MMGRYEEALSAVDTAIEISPDNSLAYCTKGETLPMLGRSEEASSAVERALELASSPSFAYSA
jgi:Flp pilus assembly protein TadD